jgi:hypothetical protein
MKHPVFGEIVWVEDRWCGWVQVAFFADFNMDARRLLAERLGKFDPRVRSDEAKQGEVELSVDTPEGDEPSSSQERAFLQFLENQQSICAAVIDAIFDEYQSDLEFWRTGDNLIDELMVPSLQSPDGLKRLLRLLRVKVLAVARDGCAFIGFSFDCTWDEEHGVGVLVHGTRVVKIGDYSVASKGPSTGAV